MLTLDVSRTHDLLKDARPSCVLHCPGLKRMFAYVLQVFTVVVYDFAFSLTSSGLSGNLSVETVGLGK